jgi:hypothetical protein
MHRPTKMKKGVLRSDWATKPNVHLDLNPANFFDPKCRAEVNGRLGSLRYDAVGKHRAFISENNDVHSTMGRLIQGILNLGDLPSTRQGGGTHLVPGSHRSLSGWVSEELMKGTLPSAVGPTPDRFGPDVMATAQRVRMRPGSLVIWDQRLIHGSTVNKSRNFRYGIPIRFFYSE